MNELDQALAKVVEAHREGVELAQYLEAERIFDERNPDAELRFIVGGLARITAAHNGAIALLIQFLQLKE